MKAYSFWFGILTGAALMIWWQHGCNEPIPVDIDTAKHEVVIVQPTPDTIYVPHDSIIYEIVYKDRKLATRLRKERDSLLLLRNSLNDSAVFARLDSIRNDICDSVLHYRTYTQKVGDDRIDILAKLGLLGYPDTLKISWKFKPTPIQPVPFGLYLGGGAGPHGIIQAQVLMGRKNLAGASITNVNSENYVMGNYVFKIR